MRGVLVIVALMAVACQPPPGTGVTVINNPASSAPTAGRAAPIPGGQAAIASGTGYQAQSRVDPLSAPVGVSRSDMMRSIDPMRPSSAAESANSRFDVGAMGQLPPDPSQQAPVFQGLRQDLRPQ